jgi:hypothetical protein
MADSNLTGSINDLVARCTSLIPTANAKELFDISLCLKSINRTENNTTENLISTRVGNLLSTATPLEKHYLSRAVYNLLETNVVVGVDLPTKTGHTNKLLETNGISTSWSKVDSTDVTGLDFTAAADGKALGFDGTNISAVDSPFSSIETIASSANLVSGTSGQFIYAIAEDTYHYWNGSAWQEITKAAAYNWIDANTIWYASFDTHRNEQISNYGNGGVNQINANTAVVSATSTGISGNALKNINSGGVQYDFSSFSMGSNFTIEFWGYIDTLGSTPAYWFDTGMVEYRTDMIDFDGAGGSSTNASITASTSSVTGQWVHHAIVFSGYNSGGCKVYHNGSQVAYLNPNAGTPNISRVKLYLHETSNNGIDSAYIKHFRISNTVRYTTNFTPPAIE